MNESYSGWPRIRFGELVGYASADFLSLIEGNDTEKDNESEEETGKMIPVSHEALLALADATDALRFESAAFADWTEKINKMQEAAESVLAYLKGDD